MQPTKPDATQGRLMDKILGDAARAQLERNRATLFGPNARSAVRVKDAADAGMRSTQDARVEVRRWREDDGSPCVEGAVYSIMNPGLFKRVRLDPRSPTALVEAAAGACAEGCCEQFRDPFDPARCAAQAAEGYRRLLGRA